MKPKHIFLSQRVLLLPMAALLCVISFEVTRHPLTKYHIPLIGWIVSVSEYRQASNAYLQAIDGRLNSSQQYFATQTAYEHTHVASLSTLAFLALCLIVINRLWRKTDLNVTA
jgi:hypothetical protein